MKSTLAAETLTLIDGCDASYFTASFKKELLLTRVKRKIHIQAFINNNSLFEILNTTNLVLDKRLCVEILVSR